MIMENESEVKEISLNEFRDMEIVHGKRGKNIRRATLSKFGIRKPAVWEQVKNYLSNIQGYKRHNILNAMRVYISHNKDFDFQIRENRAGVNYVIFFDKKLDNRFDCNAIL